MLVELKYLEDHKHYNLNYLKYMNSKVSNPDQIQFHLFDQIYKS